VRVVLPHRYMSTDHNGKDVDMVTGVVMGTRTRFDGVSIPEGQPLTETTPIEECLVSFDIDGWWNRFWVRADDLEFDHKR